MAFFSSLYKYHAVPYRTVPYRAVPYRTVPYRTVPYLGSKMVKKKTEEGLASENKPTSSILRQRAVIVFLPRSPTGDKDRQ